MAPLDHHDEPGETPYRRHAIPKLGFENYWYPIILSSELGRKPKAVRLLGRDIVLFRDENKIFALQDRCPHRGVKLSLGQCSYPGSGTISCPYHGWTFEGASGRLVAALMEGPDAAVVRKVEVANFPVQARAGLIWLWPGSMTPSNLAHDVPAWIGDQDSFFNISMYTDYRCNWRWLVDNWPQDHHAQYVHRNSPELIFQPQLPYALNLDPQPLEGNKGLAIKRSGGMTGADYPGLGRFPRREWWRFMKPTGRGATAGFENSKARKVYGIRNQSEIWLPGLTVVGRLSGEYCLIQWAVPIDGETTRCFNINNWRRMGRSKEWFARAHYYLFRRWVHDRMFSDQDKALIESTVPGPERLSRTDVGVIAWRKFAGASARRPPGDQPARLDVA
ncbi:Rieske 2Fe-2S domain-containing protein [Rhodopila sp.]|uniref:Rieske 2Fe-2S domain-containing protein n=1 Tax=Rhodopila sp. TaxID=2480087 RepID=UPI003D0A1A75